MNLPEFCQVLGSFIQGKAKTWLSQLHRALQVRFRATHLKKWLVTNNACTALAAASCSLTEEDGISNYSVFPNINFISRYLTAPRETDHNGERTAILRTEFKPTNFILSRWATILFMQPTLIEDTSPRWTGSRGTILDLWCKDHLQVRRTERTLCTMYGQFLERTNPMGCLRELGSRSMSGKNATHFV